MRSSIALGSGFDAQRRSLPSASRASPSEDRRSSGSAGLNLSLTEAYSCERNYCLASFLDAGSASDRQAAHQDVEDLRAHVQQFVRRFGLLVTRQTPCGFPVSPSYAHALMLLLRRTSDGLETLQSDLAAGLGIDKSNVAGCASGWWTRPRLQSVPPADGRSRLVTLTPKGTRVAQRIEQAAAIASRPSRPEFPRQATRRHRGPGGPECRGGGHCGRRRPMKIWKRSSACSSARRLSRRRGSAGTDGGTEPRTVGHRHARRDGHAGARSRSCR